MRYNPAPKIPETIDSKEQIELHLNRVKTWAAGQYICNIKQYLNYFDNYMIEYYREDFNGRFKTNVTSYYEQASKILIKIIHDKSKSKRKASIY